MRYASLIGWALFLATIACSSSRASAATGPVAVDGMPGTYISKTNIDVHVCFVAYSAFKDGIAISCTQ